MEDTTRDYRWSRTERAYKILTKDTSEVEQDSYCSVIKTCYQDNISDELVSPNRINILHIKNNDGIIFLNFRTDKIRQIV